MRLAEGFSFAYSSAGIINMVLEVQMRGSTEDCYHPCTIQYVLFPPHVISNPTPDRDSDSDKETDEGTIFFSYFFSLTFRSVTKLMA